MSNHGASANYLTRSATRLVDNELANRREERRTLRIKNALSGMRGGGEEGFSNALATAETPQEVNNLININRANRGFAKEDRTIATEDRKIKRTALEDENTAYDRALTNAKDGHLGLMIDWYKKNRPGEDIPESISTMANNKVAELDRAALESGNLDVRAEMRAAPASDISLKNTPYEMYVGKGVMTMGVLNDWKNGNKPMSMEQLLGKQLQDGVIDWDKAVKLRQELAAAKGGGNRKIGSARETVLWKILSGKTLGDGDLKVLEITTKEGANDLKNAISLLKDNRIFRRADNAGKKVMLEEMIAIVKEVKGAGGQTEPNDLGASEAPEGTIATNPKTEQKAITKNGRWVPAEDQ